MTHPDRHRRHLTRLAHWALTREERQHFAWMVARHRAAQEALTIFVQGLLRQAEARTLAALNKGPDARRGTRSWGRREEAHYRHWLTTLLTEAAPYTQALHAEIDRRQLGLSAFAARRGFRTAAQLIAALGLDHPPLAANAP